MGRLVKGLVILMLLVSTTIASTDSPGPVLWRGLPPGKYKVGFKTVWKYDDSRSFLTATNWKGDLNPQSSSRPIRLSMWFPASPERSSELMEYEGYISARRKENDVPDYEKRMLDYDRSSVANMVGGEGAQFESLLSTPTAAYKDAPPAEGRFPIIVYSLGQNDHNLENVVLCEFLASYGFVVATVADLGPSSRVHQLIVDDPASYETQIRDLEFALQEALKMPSADGTRVAAVGHSMGGIYAVLLAMRNARIRAVVGLDASFMETLPAYYYKFQDAYYYDPSKFKSPMLSIFRTDQTLDLTALKKLRYSDRYLIGVPAVIHADFTSFPLITATLPTDKLNEYARSHRDQKTAVQASIFIAETVRDFLLGTFKLNAGSPNDFQARAQSTRFLNQTVSYQKMDSLAAPTEQDFYEIIVTLGVESAISIYDQAEARYPAAEIVRWNVIDRIGSEAQWQRQPQDAVKVFQFSAHVFPQSADVCDELGDAYAEIGNKKEAVASYRKALTINPKDSHASDRIQKLQDSRP